jgi:hypothetical protein
MRQNTKLLLVVITVLLMVGAAIYALYGGSSAGGGGGGGANPCSSAKMPTLGAGLECVSKSTGQYAGISSTSTAGGVAVPASAQKLSQYAATDSACVSESVCQAYCSAAPNCDIYFYDSSNQVATSKCPDSGSVCTTYAFAGGLPMSVGASSTPFVYAGIPARELLA